MPNAAKNNLQTSTAYYGLIELPLGRIEPLGVERFDLSPGGFTFLPRGIAHSYYVRSAHARWLVTLSPAGFERFFVEVGHSIEPATPPPQSIVPDPAEFTKRLARYEVDFIGPAPSPDA